jgi:hypothetical protein
VWACGPSELWRTAKLTGPTGKLLALHHHEHPTPQRTLLLPGPQIHCGPISVSQADLAKSCLSQARRCRTPICLAHNRIEAHRLDQETQIGRAAVGAGWHTSGATPRGAGFEPATIRSRALRPGPVPWPGLLARSPGRRTAGPPLLLDWVDRCGGGGRSGRSGVDPAVHPDRCAGQRSARWLEGRQRMSASTACREDMTRTQSIKIGGLEMMGPGAGHCRPTSS